jgi:hypothetical protein
LSAQGGPRARRLGIQRPPLTPSAARAGNLDAQSIEFFNGIGQNRLIEKLFDQSGLAPKADLT